MKRDESEARRRWARAHLAIDAVRGPLARDRERLKEFWGGIQKD